MKYKDVLIEQANIIPKCVGEIAKVILLPDKSNDPNKLYLVIGNQVVDGETVIALQDAEFRVWITCKTNVIIQPELSIDNMYPARIE